MNKLSSDCSVVRAKKKQPAEADQLSQAIYICLTLKSNSACALMYRDQCILLFFSFLFSFQQFFFFPSHYAQILLLHKNFAHQKFDLLAKSTIVIINTMPSYTVLYNKLKLFITSRHD